MVPPPLVNAILLGYMTHESWRMATSGTPQTECQGKQIRSRVQLANRSMVLSGSQALRLSCLSVSSKLVQQSVTSNQSKVLKTVEAQLYC